MLVFGFTLYLPINWSPVVVSVPGPILRVFGDYKVSCIVPSGVSLGNVHTRMITTIISSSGAVGSVVHNAFPVGGTCTYLN